MSDGTIEIIFEEMKEAFEREFSGRDAEMAARAPGRVNLIGEHTDYNQGFVLPIAIGQAVYLAGRPAENRDSRVYSMNFGETHEFSLDDSFNGGRAVGWARYVEGVVRVLEERTGKRMRGVDAVLWGNVPLGSGLSSSAALEVATGYFYLRANGLDVPLPQLARYCQEAENLYAGVQCGIMDQFASCLGREGHAIFLDCRSLEYEYVPATFESHVLMILNTGVSRGLAGSAYNDRRAACEAGVAEIRKIYPDVTALRDVSVEQFASLVNILPGEVAGKCRHIVTENARVLNSIECLNGGDVGRFGRLLNASHASLRDDYEVTCRELDFLHDAARSMPGVAGERMTGAGFGGCAIALVSPEAADAVQAELVSRYRESMGLNLEVYRTTARQGVQLFEI